MISHANIMLDSCVKTSDNQIPDLCFCHVRRLLRCGALVKIKQVKLCEQASTSEQKE